MLHEDLNFPIGLFDPRQLLQIQVFVAANANFLTSNISRIFNKPLHN